MLNTIAMVSALIIAKGLLAVADSISMSLTGNLYVQSIPMMAEITKVLLIFACAAYDVYTILGKKK